MKKAVSSAITSQTDWKAELQACLQKEGHFAQTLASIRKERGRQAEIERQRKKQADKDEDARVAREIQEAQAQSVLQEGAPDPIDVDAPRRGNGEGEGESSTPDKGPQLSELQKWQASYDQVAFAHLKAVESAVSEFIQELVDSVSQCGAIRFLFSQGFQFL
uniref:Uncharacterized protein n=1 Tax=Chromera velia CCMP2878 TaxID=1169474 RepID=A0A0G4H667_9ALVE|eukprot:Cvel_24775.t1-p1 / transcript=Cvel_24775.t1 / gene=Cvel_24775 / organism=Chromera_velia_CCMP2878 / gene_product=hypothetical protein / transcript_product=hypothetical protein / location=Cvel_scaffold2724:756-10629(+) / protein_length=161 / sequence_SO=supercontig / SO=protein_coding / is_pseudo=false